MGFFDKKYCDICGSKIGMLGNKKLSDGNMCKDCEKQLSNWFTGRKESTVDQIKAQIDYREANKANAAAFKATREIGTSDYKTFLVDEDHGWFILLNHGEALDKNPDVFEISKVKDVHIDVACEMSEALGVPITEANAPWIGGERNEYLVDSVAGVMDALGF